MDEPQSDSGLSETSPAASDPSRQPDPIEQRMSPSAELMPFELREEESQPFVGRWHGLVSNTNWEKGRIISEWRQSLIEADAPATAYSDEAWSKLVGGVTSQHVGRLRRVYLRFRSTNDEYEGLYWSHFQAALEWNDAEMWLEGAVQNSWSISQMRNQRWEARGAAADQKPRDEDIVADIDEDYEPLQSRSGEDAPHRISDDQISSGPRSEGPDFGDESGYGEGSAKGSADAGDGASIYSENAAGDASIDFVRPFENLSELPEDIADAFDTFKLAIIRHRSAGWADISMEDLLGCLDALKELAKLPSDDS